MSYKLFKGYLLMFFLILGSFISFSQNIHTCGFDHLHRKNMQDPAYRQMWEQHNEMLRNQIQSPKPKAGTIYQIPVVVHVLHKGETIGLGSNISDAQIQGAISNLTDVYRKVLTSQVSSQSVDVEVEFVLAKRDPNCNASNGIVRVDATGVAGYTQYGVKLDGTVGADETTLKDLSKWPTDQYMNFWIVSEIDDNNGGSGIQGYANLPVGIDAYNGAVMMANVFGYNPGAGMDNSTVIHEVGHFLDLYHPFEDGDVGVCPPSENSTTCATQGDFVCDTPPTMNYLGYQSNTVYFNCPAGTNNPCSTGNLDQVIHNFMNYTSCPDRFTAGQKTRMTAALQTSRASLTASLGLTPPSGTFTAPIAATCSPKTTGQGITGYYGGIVETKFSNLDKVSSSTNVDNPTTGYMDFTTSCLNVSNVVTNQTYPLTITTFGANNERVKAWIDYNNDGDFNDAGEDLTPTYLNAQATNNYTVTQSVTIPASPVLNTNLRMRVISDWNSTPTNCQQNLNLGQAEDYTIYITGPATLDCDFTANNTTSCANSTIIFTSSNISGTATSWNWTVTPNTGVTYTNSTNSTSQNPQMIFSNAGTYTIEMIASDGTNSETTTKTNYITINSLPTITETITDPTCGTNGSVVYVASNGLAPYTLTFNSTVQGSMTVSNLGAGTYNYSISDANTCITTGTSSLTNAGGPNVSISGTDATCGLDNGVGTISVTGNTLAPTISWSSGGTNLVENNLAAGTYTATVDVDGCTFNLNLTIANGTGPQLSISSTNASCGNAFGTATATVTGNTGIPVYSWDNGGSTATISNLTPATYSVTVTVDGCTLNDQAIITSANPTLSLNTVQPSCGQNNGSITATISGNSGTPIYTWSNGNSTASISNLAAGNYTLTVNVDGCTLNDASTLTSSSAASVNLNPTQPTCGNANGSITAVVTGNTGAPTYTWSNGGSTATVSNLVAGNYTLTVNVDGCTINSNTTLTTNNPIVTLNPTQPSCGLDNGTITAVVSGNIGVPIYLWNNGAATPTISNLANGSYSVSIMVDGCPLSASTTLLGSTIQVALTTVDPTCGGNDGSITSILTGNVGIPTYTWSNNETTDVISNLAPGNYSLQVNVDGCTLNIDTILLNNASNAGILHSSQWVCLNSDFDITITDNLGDVVDWYMSTDNTNYTAIGNQTTAYTYKVKSQQTKFYVIVKNGDCPADTSNKVTINTYTQPSVDVPESIEVISGNSFPISGTASVGTYTWTPAEYVSNTSTLSTNINVDSSVYIYLTVVDDNGCINRDSTIVFVIDSLINDLRIPSAFSPNGDGINERLEFFNIIGIDKFEFVLFDRWGNIVYKSSVAGDKWDGTFKGEKVITGVYTYTVNYHYINGNQGKKGGYLEIIN